MPTRHDDLKIPISVLVLIHNRNREVLLIERADRPDFWQSVTGSLDEANESLESAAIREVAEETGIDVFSYRVHLCKTSITTLIMKSTRVGGIATRLV